ncbi:hypothetical protein F2Q69_00012917 [Brassica cretica]|uniref:Uncharacterized protein n=1 Tax=Brassica cretica TaxID=69181 RepID=A0A8S9QTM4_BRACR|nr:hypothetical protein F2Q69_00012917 [Brassica cretica]
MQDVEGEEKSDASDEDVEGEESEEEVGEKGLANNVEESGDDSAGQGDGGVGTVRKDTANEEGGRPAEELLVFEAIPKLRKEFRVPVEGADVYCLRMCQISFKQNGMKGVSLSEISKALGEETGEGMKMLKMMQRLIKRVDKKVDKLDERLVPLEAFVKDVEKKTQRKK